jgi:hypothetical protein
LCIIETLINPEVIKDVIDGITIPLVYFLVVSLSCSKMAFAIGTIMAVVAVLLIHIDRNQVGAIRPSIILQNTMH